LNKSLQTLLAGILLGLLAAGLILLIATRPRGEPITLSIPPTPAPLTIHVAGAVVQPGLYILPPGSRVNSAIQAAGGLKGNADPTYLNLAAPLRDGDRVWVATQVTPTVTAPPGEIIQTTEKPVKITPVPPSADHPLDINSATLAQLDLLPGIGSVKAEAIISYRNTHGPFLDIEELLNVPGITPSVLAKIRDVISVLPEP
jgi:competence protein ComEA